MSGFRSVRDIVDRQFKDGQIRRNSWFKSITTIALGGSWFDLNFVAGSPSPIYYANAPLTALALSQSSNGGLWHGGNVTTRKYLRKTTVQSNNATPLPIACILVDCLLAYPFVDEGTSDVQSMTNTQTLPRYTDGAGVQVMAVSVAPPSGLASARFQFTYTNQSGTAGRVSRECTFTNVTANGQIITSTRAFALAQGSPFIPLQEGDTGVRSIQSVQMTFGSDVGLFTLVLCKPLADTQITETTAPVECDHYINKNEMPGIENNACLSWLINPQGSTGATRLQGTMEFAWKS